MKVGDIVIYDDNNEGFNRGSRYSYLTSGKSYRVVGIKDYMFYIVDDSGYENGFYLIGFKTLKHIRKEKLLKLIFYEN